MTVDDRAQVSIPILEQVVTYKLEALESKTFKV